SATSEKVDFHRATLPNFNASGELLQGKVLPGSVQFASPHLGSSSTSRYDETFTSRLFQMPTPAVFSG
ncbi:MAG: hypothetical protein QF922_04875, partial [SAR324 cluster bacterium]|nr:hypothetical protein [SAR324 cluster bacterium]